MTATRLMQPPPGVARLYQSFDRRIAAATYSFFWNRYRRLILSNQQNIWDPEELPAPFHGFFQDFDLQRLLPQ
jgi:hypothetical protein